MKLAADRKTAETLTANSKLEVLYLNLFSVYIRSTVCVYDVCDNNADKVIDEYFAAIYIATYI